MINENSLIKNIKDADFMKNFMESYKKAMIRMKKEKAGWEDAYNMPLPEGENIEEHRKTCQANIDYWSNAIMVSIQLANLIMLIADNKESTKALSDMNSPEVNAVLKAIEERNPQLIMEAYFKEEEGE